MTTLPLGSTICRAEITTNHKIETIFQELASVSVSTNKTIQLCIWKKVSICDTFHLKPKNIKLKHLSKSCAVAHVDDVIYNYLTLSGKCTKCTQICIKNMSNSTK